MFHDVHMYHMNQEEDIVEDENLFKAAKCAKMNDAEIEKCLQLIEDPEVKETLKKTTEEAVEQGVN